MSVILFYCRFPPGRACLELVGLAALAIVILRICLGKLHVQSCLLPARPQDVQCMCWGLSCICSRLALVRFAECSVSVSRVGADVCLWWASFPFRFPFSFLYDGSCEASCIELPLGTLASAGAKLWQKCGGMAASVATKPALFCWC